MQPIGPSAAIAAFVFGLRAGAVVLWLGPFIDAGAAVGCGIPAAGTIPPVAFVVGNVFAIFWMAILVPRSFAAVSRHADFLSCSIANRR